MQRHSTLVITIDSNSRFKHNGKDKIQRRVFISLLHSKLVLFHHWAPLICMRGALQIKLDWCETTKQQILTSEAKSFFFLKIYNYNKNKCKTVERHTWGGISRCGEGAAGCALRLAVSLKDLPVRARSVWPGYSDIIMERSITAGHCCETSYFPQNTNECYCIRVYSVTPQSSNCVHDNIRVNVSEDVPMCKHDPRPTQRGDNSLLPGNPEQPWGSWGPMEIWVLLPSPWPALVPPETPTAKI